MAFELHHLNENDKTTKNIIETNILATPNPQQFDSNISVLIISPSVFLSYNKQSEIAPLAKSILVFQKPIKKFIAAVTVSTINQLHQVLNLV